MTKFPLALRLSSGPAVAAITVVILAGLTVFDLGQGRRREEADREATKERLKHSPSGRRVPLTEDVPALTEADALRVVQDLPTRAAVERLWPIEKHREALFKLLLSKQTPEEVRIFIFGSFEEIPGPKALQATRALMRENLAEGPLLFSAWELIARQGEGEDLALLGERPGESYQLKAVREGYRNALSHRVR